MAEPWIRVHANLMAKPVVGRAADALGVKRHEAVGLLVTFWGSVSQHATDGMVGAQSDSQLESWADWRGKRGRFAAFIRERHLDADGRVNEWEDYQGPLDARRANDRERQRRHRERRQTSRDASHSGHGESNGGVTRDVSRDVTVTSALTRANETKRDETIFSQSVNPAGDAEVALAVRLNGNAERVALTAVVARSNSPSACIAALSSMLSGNDPATPQPTEAQLGQALLDFSANGDRWNAALFRGYLKRAMAPPPERSPPNGTARAARASAQGGARNDAAMDAWLADKERARSETVEPEPEEIPHGE